MGTDDVDAGMTVVTSLLWQMADVSDARLTKVNGGRLTVRGVRHCLPFQAGAPPFLPPSRVWVRTALMRVSKCGSAEKLGPQNVRNVSNLGPEKSPKIECVQGSGFRV